MEEISEMMAAENGTAEAVANDMPTPKINQDWYQTESHVILTVFAKNAENVKASYTDTTLSLSAKLPSGGEYSLELDLAHRIVPAECSHKAAPSKIEVKLKKRDGIKWNTLEGSPSEQEPVQPIPQAILEASCEPPKNPSSSKKARDWEKVEKEIKKQEEEEKSEGDAAVRDLFLKIYYSGSDDVKRAMTKSYLESGGTVLSTNWAEVGSNTVVRKPPEGMEWKSWDS